MEHTPDAASITPPEVLKTIAWDGFHDLSDADELKAMVTAFIQRGERLALVQPREVGSSRVDLQACKLEYSIVSPK